MSVMSGGTLLAGRHHFPCVVPSLSLTALSFEMLLFAIFFRDTEVSLQASDK